MITDNFKTITASDALACTVLHHACFSNAGWSLEQITGSIALPTTLGWMIYNGAEAIGLIFAQQTIDATEILTLGVHPTLRRRGLGENLLGKAIETARAENHTHIFLEVAEDNLPALRLYQKCSFANIGKRPFYYPRATGPVAALNFRLDLTA